MKQLLRRSRLPLFNQRGISLMEVLVAIAIVGISLVFIMMMEGRKWFDFGRTQELNSAIRMIENKVEGIRSTISADPTNNFPPVSDTTNSGSITLITTVSDAYDNSATPVLLPNVRMLDLEATWEVKGVPDTLQVTTYVARNF